MAEQLGTAGNGIYTKVRQPEQEKGVLTPNQLWAGIEPVKEAFEACIFFGAIEFPVAG